MNAQHASDEVTDLIASIEMHRQEIERESGLEASRTYALPRLQELLRTEQEAATQPPGAEAGVEVNRAANIEAVNAAIRKLQSLGRGGQRHGQGKQQQRPFQGQGPGGGRRDNNQRRERHRGRRSQARRGGR